MPGMNASSMLLGGQANFQATDWAEASASAQLDVKATAELKRGVNLELGAQTLIALDASISKFLALDLRGQASAAARVRAQVQVPLDLFDEAGLAIRLQAVAEAAAGVELGIGLTLGDFLRLAGQDPHMGGIGLRLLRVLLEEAEIKGGVLAKAAAAAMAYANVSCTGRLIPAAGVRAGFTVAAEAGLGLKAGAGFRVFAEFGLTQPQRLIRKTVDAVVDETLGAITQAIPDQAGRSVVDELRAPAKMALRACFEVGAELARNNGQFSAAHGNVIAQRSVTVFLEEAQRYVLERITELALELFEDALRNIGFNENTWDAAEPQRLALSAELRNIPADPFEPTQDNKDYWGRVLTKSVDLAVALGSRHRAAEPWMEPLSMVWAATQLLYQSVERISDTQVRASFLQSSVSASVPAFTGRPQVAAPPKIAERINSVLRPGQPPQTLTQQDLVAYLLRASVLDELMSRYPAVRVVVDVVGGPNAAHVAALTQIFDNLGAFVPSGGGVDASQSLQVILDGLSTYVHTRLRGEFEAVARPVLAGQDPELQLYLDEVLLDSLGFTLNTVFAQVLDWSRGSQTGHKALREACSAVVMKICSRSLVVTADIILNKALAEVSGGFRTALTQLNARGGVVDKLSVLVPMIDRRNIKDAVEEIFDLAADTFEPLPAAQRARIRNLLYRITDTAPAGGGAGLVEELKNDSFIPNAEAAVELAMELGVLVRDLFVRLIQRILEMLATQALEAIRAVLEFVEGQIKAWVREIDDFLGDVAAMLTALAAEITRLHRQLEEAADRLLDKTEAFLGVLASSRGSSVRSKAKSMIRSACLGALGDNPLYTNLPSAGKDVVKDALDDTIDAIADNEIVDDLFEALGTVAGATADFLEEAREISEEDDVAGELIERLADRVEDGLRDAFGSRITIPISFRAEGTFRGPRIDTLFGSYRPSITIDLRFNLGQIRIDIDDVVSAMRSLVLGLTSAADDLADALAECVRLEVAVNGKEVEQENLLAHEQASLRRAAETRAAGPTVRVIEPGAGAAYAGGVPVEIALAGVPESFLGKEEGEIERVFVFLNDAPFPISRFTTSTRTPDAPVTAIDRANAGIRVAHPIVAGRAQRFKEQQTEATAQRVVRLNGHKGLGQSSVSGRLSVRGKSSAGGGKVSGATRPGGPTLGRKPRPSERARARESMKPELVLETRLSNDEVRDGFNTMVVVVSSGASDARVSETVVFLSADTAATKADNPFRQVGTKLPATPVLDPSLLAPQLRGGVKVKPAAAGRDRKPGLTLRNTRGERQQKELEQAHGSLVERLTGEVKATTKVRADVKARKLGGGGR